MIRDALMFIGGMTAMCALPLTLLALAHTSVLMLSYWSIKAEHYESEKDFRQQR